MCGGPSKEQKEAAAAQGALDRQLAGQYQAGSAVTTPIYTDLAQKGLPFFNAESQYQTSNLARQANQAKAGMNARRAGYGRALPSGFAEAQNRGFDADIARIFDMNQLDLLQQQENAKLTGAAGLNPLAYATASQGGNQSIMQAPLQNHFWGNLVQGLVQGGAKVASDYAG